MLNRNVILRKHDRDGFVFVTERNTKKYTDFVRSRKDEILMSAVFMEHFFLGYICFYFHLDERPKGCRCVFLDLYGE